MPAWQHIPVLRGLSPFKGLKGQKEPSLPPHDPADDWGRREHLLYWLCLNAMLLANPRALLENIRQAAALWREASSRRNTTATLTPIELDLPLDGAWSVASGGMRKEDSHSWLILGQRFAVDFIGTLSSVAQRGGGAKDVGGATSARRRSRPGATQHGQAVRLGRGGLPRRLGVGKVVPDMLTHRAGSEAGGRLTRASIGCSSEGGTVGLGLGKAWIVHAGTHQWRQAGAGRRGAADEPHQREHPH